jgi:lysophospholipase L1-like esterase
MVLAAFHPPLHERQFLTEKVIVFAPEKIYFPNMNIPHRPFFFAAALTLFLPFANAQAQDTNQIVVNTATNRVPGNANWLKRHENFVAQAKQGGVDLLFVGDSITDFWHDRGSKIWNQFYAPRHAANFGISGDRTENVLWRIDNGELDGIHPKVVVLMIGTNNTGKKNDGSLRNSVPQIIQGVTAVVDDIRTKLPDTKILLLGIFPRGNLEDFSRSEIALINTVIAKLDDGKTVKFLDLTPDFLEADGTLPRSIMPDLLHPNAHGYQIWADAMEPTLAELLK